MLHGPEQIPFATFSAFPIFLFFLGGGGGGGSDDLYGPVEDEAGLETRPGEGRHGIRF